MSKKKGEQNRMKTLFQPTGERNDRVRKEAQNKQAKGVMRKLYIKGEVKTGEGIETRNCKR